MLPIILDRKIARLETARDLVYYDAMKAYHEGPNWLLPKLEARVEEMNSELVAALVEERARRICHALGDGVGHWPRYEAILLDEAHAQLQKEGLL